MSTPGRYLRRMAQPNVLYDPRGSRVPAPDRRGPPSVVEKIPAGYAMGPEGLVNARLPVWQDPTYASQPVDVEGEFVPLDHYETSYLTLSRTTLEGFCTIITGISYEVACRVQYDLFVISVYRDGDLLSSWEDILINPAAANPAERFALGGHVRRIPYYGRIGRNETLTIRMLCRGVEPFNKTPADLLMCSARSMITGWMAPLDSSREGRAQVAEGGELLQYPPTYANADQDPLRNLPQQIQDDWQ